MTVKLQNQKSNPFTFGYNCQGLCKFITIIFERIVSDNYYLMTNNGQAYLWSGGYCYGSSSVREYVFYVFFFRFQKNMTFYVFTARC